VDHEDRVALAFVHIVDSDSFNSYVVALKGILVSLHLPPSLMPDSEQWLLVWVLGRYLPCASKIRW